jgi:carbamoyl-phosphate synthase large subunit
VLGYGILRSLSKSDRNLTLIGTSIFEDSAAQGFCAIFEKAVPTNSPNYLEWLLSIIRKHQIDLIIPGIEADLYEWCDHFSEIQQTGAQVLMNNPELVCYSRDKKLFYEQLCHHNVTTAIPTSFETDLDILKEQFGLPIILKPRCGFGSKGIVRAGNRETFMARQAQIGTVLMAQPFVGTDDEEYSTSAFGDGQGSFFAHMTLRRKLAAGGFTEKAEVIELASIKKAITELCLHFKPLGPTNFQFRIHHCKLKLLEINPRISSATSIRTAFGYNESLMSVEYFLENIIPSQPLIRNGRAARYYEHCVFYEENHTIAPQTAHPGILVPI